MIQYSVIGPERTSVLVYSRKNVSVNFCQLSRNAVINLRAKNSRFILMFIEPTHDLRQNREMLPTGGLQVVIFIFITLSFLRKLSKIFLRSYIVSNTPSQLQ